MKLLGDTGWKISLAMSGVLAASTAFGQGPGSMPPAGPPMFPGAGRPVAAVPGGSAFPPSVATLAPDGTQAPATLPEGTPAGQGNGPGCFAPTGPAPAFGGGYHEPECCMPALPMPTMIGDGYLGYYASRLLAVQTTLTDAVEDPSIRTGLDAYHARVPILSRGAFRIAENESPQPTSRVYWKYDYFHDVRARFRYDGSALVDVDGTNAGLVTTVPGPLFRATLDEVKVRRDTFGLECADLDRVCSIGIRLTVVGGRQGVALDPNVQTIIDANGGDDTTVFSSASVVDGLEDSEFADLTIIGKVVVKGDCDCGDVITAGLAATIPSGNGFYSTADPGRRIHPTLLQPFVGWTCDHGHWYVHGFSSLIVPTDRRDPLLMFHDIGLGCWLYKNECADSLCLNGIAPTVELHVGTPMRGRGAIAEPIGAVNTVVMTAGMHFFTFNWTSVTTGINLPLSGPRPYDMQVTTAVNVRF